MISRRRYIHNGAIAEDSGMTEAAEHVSHRQTATRGAPSWARKWLIAAGIYNLVWGAAVIAFPGLLFSLTGMDAPRYPQIWQCVGMIVGVYGVGYLAASLDARRHWPIVLVGLLGKIFGPMGFAFGVINGDLPLGFGATILTNDLIWWIPFTMMLWDAAKYNSSPEARGLPSAESLHDTLATLRDAGGRTLADVTDERPTVLALLRHKGCCFCGESMAALKEQRPRLDAQGLAVRVVTMSGPDANAALAARNGLPAELMVSDPEQLLYRALGLGRGTASQLFGPHVWVRGIRAVLDGHRVGALAGDGFQLPGTALIYNGRVLRVTPARDAAEQMDACAIAETAVSVA